MTHRAEVRVTLKKNLLDPQGNAVRDALKSLGFNGVKSVRVGKLIEIEVEGDSPEAVKEQLEQMGKKLLANPVMEDYLVGV